jgi:hypothetical protein
MHLPVELIFTILCYLDVKVLYSKAAYLNKAFLMFVRRPGFFKALLHRDLQLKAPRLDYQTYIAILRANSPCYTASQDVLKFIGFATTGGEIDSAYGLKKLFKKSGPGYSTNYGTANVTCAGMLDRSQASIRLEALKYLELFGHSLSDEVSNATVRYSLQTLMAERSSDRLIANMCKRLRAALNKPFYAHIDRDISEVEADSRFACLHRLSISRKGNYSCPVRSMLVLCSDTYFPIESPLFTQFNDLKSYEDVRQAHQKRLVPSFDNPHQSRACTYLEFKHTSSLLRPIIWLKFTQGRSEEVKIVLTRRFSCKFVYVKLIDCEDRREASDWHDNDVPTDIDIQHVLCIGTTFYD